jgi:outer membrane protein OmpA-like peptidoglycan-associated protein
VKSTTILAAIVTTALLGACASAPRRIELLEQARLDVETLAQDPLAAQAASRELTAARESLQRADNALEKREPQQNVEHYAYLASREAQAGEARVAEAKAKDQVARGESDRNRVLLEARTREAQAAAQEARTAQATAQAQTRNAEVARQEADASRAAAEGMQQQLAELQAKQTERGMVLTLSDVLFDTNAATLKPGATAALERVAQFMEKNPQTRLVVEGHTDSRGSEAYNEELSRRRALAVADELATRGVTRDRIEVIGRGKVYPVASNDTAAGRQQNRRVEIVFSDEGGKFARGSSEGALR